MDSGPDITIINSCSVTADADSSCRQMIRKILREKPDSRVVVTGCYAERAPDELREMSPGSKSSETTKKPLIAVALESHGLCPGGRQASVTALSDRTRAYIKDPGRLRRQMHLLHHPVSPADPVVPSG